MLLNTPQRNKGRSATVQRIQGSGLGTCVPPSPSLIRPDRPTHVILVNTKCGTHQSLRSLSLLRDSHVGVMPRAFPTTLITAHSMHLAVPPRAVNPPSGVCSHSSNCSNMAATSADSALTGRRTLINFHESGDELELTNAPGWLASSGGDFLQCLGGGGQNAEATKG